MSKYIQKNPMDYVKEVEEQTLTATYPNKAYSIALNDKTGFWEAYMVAFNANTKQASEVTTVGTFATKMEAEEKFKIEAAENLF